MRNPNAADIRNCLINDYLHYSKVYSIYQTTTLDVKQWNTTQILLNDTPQQKGEHNIS